MQNHAIRWLAACVTALSLCDALAEPLQPYQPGTPVSGTLRIAGGDTMYPLISAWGTAFARHHSRVALVIDRTTSLSADGVSGLMKRQTDLVAYVREPFASEHEAVRKQLGAMLDTVPVAGGSFATTGGTHAIAVYVHASNPVSRLTLAQLDAAWSASLLRGVARHALTWGDLGAIGDWANRPVHVYGMLTRRRTGNPPGIVNYLGERVLCGGDWRADVRQIQDRPGQGALAGIVEAIATDPEGIGYAGFGFARPGVKTVSLSEGALGPYYVGNRDDVETHAYPLSRTIYLGFSLRPGQKPSPLLNEFLRFVRSADGQQIIRSDKSGFLPLPAQPGASASPATNSGSVQIGDISCGHPVRASHITRRLR